MQKRTREIIALILLVMLGVGVAFAMGWYILVGHSWNVTASNIDDTIGKMDGYSVILFEGTHEQPLSQDSPQEHSQDSERSAPSSTSPSQDEQSADTASQASAEEESSAALPQSPQSNSATSKSASASESASGNQDDSARDDSGEEHPTLSEVRNSYQEKGAAVYVMDTSNLRFYDDPFVVAKEGRRIGLASIGSPARLADARRRIKLLDKQSSDFIVMLTDDATLSNRNVPGLDILICTSNADGPSMRGYRGNVFCVDAPYEGEVQAVIISPSGVISTKTIDAL